VIKISSEKLQILAYPIAKNQKKKTPTNLDNLVELWTAVD